MEKSEILERLQKKAKSFFSDEVNLSFREITDDLERLDIIEVTAELYSCKSSVLVTTKILTFDHDGMYTKERFETLTDDLAQKIVTKNNVLLPDDD